MVEFVWVVTSSLVCDTIPGRSTGTLCDAHGTVDVKDPLPLFEKSRVVI